MNRIAFFIWINSHRTAEELFERAQAIAELIEFGLGVPVYDDSDEIQAIKLTDYGRHNLPPVLPAGLS
jgi:hypothetical protein